MCAWLVEHGPKVVATIVGAASLKIFSINRGFEGTVRWLKLVRPRWSNARLHAVDTVVTTLLGAYIAWITFQPDSQANGFLAGLGWTGIINNVTLKQGSGAEAPGREIGKFNE